MTDQQQSDATEPPVPQRLSRVLVVAPHPDDETLTAGGLVAALARRSDVVLVTCTRGERGEVIGPDLAHLEADPTELAAYRTGELDRALAALGVSRHMFLDAIDGGDRLTDSGMRWEDGARHVRAVPAADAGPSAFSVVPAERPVAALAALIDTEQPDLVLVDEPGGGYGHPDHRRAHEITMAACEAASHRPRFVAWPVRPRGAVRAGQQWLAARSDRPTTGAEGDELSVPDVDGPQPSIVVPDDQVDLEIDVSAELGAQLAAMRAHRSQVQAAQVVTDVDPSATKAAGWFALSNGLLQPIYRSAWLQLAPGWGSRAELRSAVEQTWAGGGGEGRWFRPTMIAFSAVLGVVLALLGTAFHRVAPPWGLLAALVGLVAAGVLARTFVDRLGHMVCGTAAVVGVLAATYIRPGGDVLVSGDGLGVAWLVGSIPAALLLPALAPRRWFEDS